jgi:hypothetical protein
MKLKQIHQIQKKYTHFKHTKIIDAEDAKL